MIFSENLLHFIWEKKLFNEKLITVCGKSVVIIDTGTRNTNQGPDFLFSRLMIGDTEWAGNIELHLTTQEYTQHGHDYDYNYNNVILHVVWRHDYSAYSHSPILALSSFINHDLLPFYAELYKSQSIIPCVNSVLVRRDEPISIWLNSLSDQRQLNRAIKLSELLHLFNGNWEEAIWIMLCRNFGLTVNSNSFNQLALSISFSLLKRYRDSRISVEALLMGQAGILSAAFTDQYAKELWIEFNRLKALHKIEAHIPPVYFLRMRPTSFPTIRLAQLASFIEKINSLLTFCKSCESFESIQSFFNVEVTPYWDTHFVFDRLTLPHHKSLGQSFIFNLVINTIVPVLIAYGRITGEDKYIIQANELLIQLPPESNKVIKELKKIGVIPRNAKESQSCLELYAMYCSKIQCVHCKIGSSLIIRDWQC